MAIVCPITNTDRKIPFHLAVPKSSLLTEFVMVEQVKAIDYMARNAKFIEKGDAELFEEITAIVNACIE